MTSLLTEVSISLAHNPPGSLSPLNKGISRSPGLPGSLCSRGMGLLALPPIISYRLTSGPLLPRCSLPETLSTRLVHCLPSSTFSVSPNQDSQPQCHSHIPFRSQVTLTASCEIQPSSEVPNRRQTQTKKQQQKPAQHCKTVILQIKKNKIKSPTVPRSADSGPSPYLCFRFRTVSHFPFL